MLAKMRNLKSRDGPLKERMMKTLWRSTLFSVLALTAPYCSFAQLVDSGVRGSRYAIRFFGTGTGQMDRIKIPTDPDNAADVGDDFTLELWINVGSNNNGTVSTGANGDGWITGNVIVDRDIWGAGDYGDFGLSLGTYAGGTNRVLAFGINNGAWGDTFVTTSNLWDGQWHHVAVTRVRSNGLVRIYVDGVVQASGYGPTGDVSYRNGRSTPYTNSDPFLVLGAEKHDAGSEYPSFRGYMDEFRIWNIALTAEQITNYARFVLDPTQFTNIVGYWRMESGIGFTIPDSSLNSITGQLRQAPSGGVQWLAYTNNPNHTAPVNVALPILAGPVVAETNLVFSWPAFQNFRYAVETRTNLLSGSWASVAGWTNLTAADRALTFTGQVNGVEGWFYRVFAAPYR
jgi:hypothetical protein